MGRTTTLLFCCLVLTAVGAIAQESAPQTPEDAFTDRELIAWSQLQMPRPAPQPLPPAEQQVPQPQQPQDQQPKPPADPHNQEEPLHSYTGTVLSASNPCLLLAANRTYQLEAGEELRRFDNRNVQILGSISTGTQVIKVLRIDVVP